MENLASLQDRLAFEIGAQIIARHRVEAEIDMMRDQNAELQAKLASGDVQATPPVAAAASEVQPHPVSQGELPRRAE